MAAAEGPVAKFSSFANFEEKKRKSNLLMSFPKIINQIGSFGQIRKKFIISLLSADSQYFQIYALNKSHSNLSIPTQLRHTTYSMEMESFVRLISSGSKGDYT